MADAGIRIPNDGYALRESAASVNRDWAAANA